MHITNHWFVINIYNTEWHFEAVHNCAVHEWKIKSCIPLAPNGLPSSERLTMDFDTDKPYERQKIDG